MLNYPDLEILYKERRQFLLAEAEKQQLVQIATVGRISFVHLLRCWLGARLVAWGKALQGENRPEALLTAVKMRLV